jgi:predicted site-specific integrase-resolvase
MTRPARLAPLREAAPYSKFSVKTLRRYGRDGKITLYRNGAKLILVDLDELDRLVRPIAAAGDGR